MKINRDLIGALKDPLGDLTKDIAEAVWDTALEDSLLKNIPFVATMFAIKDGAIAVRDRLFAAKVARFISGVNGLSASERARAIDDLAGTTAKREQLGELLLSKLDRMDPLHKPEMLSKLFIALGRGRIAAKDFDRLSDMVVNVFLGDLRLLSVRRQVTDVEESRRFALQASGYLAWQVDEVYAGGGAKLKWSITKDGITILDHCPPDAKSE
ncbi:hypothetical protein [Xanthomonas graminis]|uniref:hypothetical protein n=1 Tax=Xanthomonas graminis TaxID=3390026 RepID=UPI001F477E64|nr:hypothetical protein [Xanthomonas translucens]UKE73894.1 hypothetical protein KFS85_02825 [Xanthomonas translucens pv. phleipratensis]